MTENIDKDYVCGDFGEVTEWLQIKVTVKTERLDDLVSLMSSVKIRAVSNVEPSITTTLNSVFLVLDSRALNSQS